MAELLSALLFITKEDFYHLVLKEEKEVRKQYSTVSKMHSIPLYVDWWLYQYFNNFCNCGRWQILDFSRMPHHQWNPDDKTKSDQDYISEKNQTLHSTMCRPWWQRCVPIVWSWGKLGLCDQGQTQTIHLSEDKVSSCLHSKHNISIQKKTQR